jgi:hypothetical protein
LPHARLACPKIRQRSQEKRLMPCPVGVGPAIGGRENKWHLLDGHH